MRWWHWLMAVAVATVLFAIFCNVWIVRAARGRMFDGSGNVPARAVALVLGTGRLSSGGQTVNPHFTHRIAAAAELYRAGKVRHFILSGDNHTHGYDEPTDMKTALLARGVPDRAVTLDYAGFRTLDSVVRAKEVFGQTRLMIVSEPFHNARALFLCRHFDIDAVAFNAQPVSLRVSRWAYCREWLARVKAVLDVYVFRVGPKFLGEKIAIQL